MRTKLAHAVEKLSFGRAVILAVPFVCGTAMAGTIQTVFVIAMENHDLTQPASFTSIQPLLGNAAAPYLNSLMTPGNPNAQYTSYASNMTNVATGVHPSEPNYIWENGGSNFGVLSDSDPSASATRCRFGGASPLSSFEKACTSPAKFAR